MKGLGGTVPLPPLDVAGLIPCGYIKGAIGKPPDGKGIPAPNVDGFKPGKFGGIWGFELLVVAVEEVGAVVSVVFSFVVGFELLVVAVEEVGAVVSVVFSFVVDSEFSLFSPFSLPFCLFSAY